jgi:hypothetical protein
MINLRKLYKKLAIKKQQNRYFILIEYSLADFEENSSY